MDELVRISDLSISFGGLRAVNDITFNVSKGEIFSIIGPNGAGKTTIFNCISGIYTPDSGAIVFDGSEIQGLNPYKIARRGLARTFQNVELFSHMTAMENILLGRHIHMKCGLVTGALMIWRRSRAAVEELANRYRAEEIIDFLDLQSVRNHFVGELPYGKQKLVELARALAMEPHVLLLDEPSAGMNNEEKQDLFFCIKDIQEEMGITILLIEHDMKMVMDISNRVMAINFGELIVIGDPEEVAKHPKVLKAYVGESHAIASN